MPTAPRSATIIDLSTSEPTRSTTSTSSIGSNPQTVSAARRSNPPANTDARSNNRRSSSVSSWYDHETVARSVWCRSSVPRPLPRSRRNRSRRRSSSSSADSDRIRAAASSIASGMPSRRSQIWTSASRCPSACERARRSPAPARRTARPPRRRRRAREHDRHVHRAPATPPDWSPGSGGSSIEPISSSTRTLTSATRCSQLSITTSRPAITDPVDDRCRATTARRPTSEGQLRCHRADDRTSVGDRGEIDEEHALVEVGEVAVAELDRRPCLAHPAGARQRDDAAEPEIARRSPPADRIAPIEPQDSTTPVSSASRAIRWS